MFDKLLKAAGQAVTSLLGGSQKAAPESPVSTTQLVNGNDNVEPVVLGPADSSVGSIFRGSAKEALQQGLSVGTNALLARQMGRNAGRAERESNRKAFPGLNMWDYAGGRSGGGAQAAVSQSQEKMQQRQFQYQSKLQARQQAHEASQLDKQIRSQQHITSLNNQTQLAGIGLQMGPANEKLPLELERLNWEVDNLVAMTSKQSAEWDRVHQTMRYEQIGEVRRVLLDIATGHIPKQDAWKYLMAAAAGKLSVRGRVFSDRSGSGSVGVQ